VSSPNNLEIRIKVKILALANCSRNNPLGLDDLSDTSRHESTLLPQVILMESPLVPSPVCALRIFIALFLTKLCLLYLAHRNNISSYIQPVDTPAFSRVGYCGVGGVD